MFDCERRFFSELEGYEAWNTDLEILATNYLSSSDECKKNCLSNPLCKTWKFDKICYLSGEEAKDVNILNNEVKSGRVACFAKINYWNVVKYITILVLILIITKFTFKQ